MRHQRTCDVVFDYYRKDIDRNYKPNMFVYRLIETLLPNANYEPGKKRFGMLELYAPSE